MSDFNMTFDLENGYATDHFSGEREPIVYVKTYRPLKVEGTLWAKADLTLPAAKYYAHAYGPSDEANPMRDKSRFIGYMLWKPGAPISETMVFPARAIKRI